MQSNGRTGVEIVTQALIQAPGRGAFLKAVLLGCCAWLLSTPLAAQVTITRLANEGVIVSDGRHRVMIDGMVVEPYSVYGGLPAEAARAFEGVSGAFAGIDLALASHRHHDHNQPRFACRFLQTSSGTEFKSSSQVIGLMREKCREFILSSPQIEQIEPEYGAPHVMEWGDARVTAFLLSHGTRKYARLQNYGHLVEMNGVNVIHIGDAAMDPTDFARAGLDTLRIDVALIPFWFFQPGPGAAVVEKYLNAPLKIAVHIPPGEMEMVRDYLREAFPAVKVLENPLDEVTFSSALSPSP